MTTKNPYIDGHDGTVGVPGDDGQVWLAPEPPELRSFTDVDLRITLHEEYPDEGPISTLAVKAAGLRAALDKLAPESRPLSVEVTDEMVVRGMEGWNSAEGQTFVTAIRAVLTAALAAAPTTDEDVHVAGSRASLGSLVEQVRDGGSRCQVDRVVIAPCDEYGSTDTELGLYAERDHFQEVANTFHAKFNEADARAEKAEARVAELEAMTPAPVAPEWHSARIVEARVLGGDRCQWASTSDGMWVSLDGANFPTHRDYLLDVTVVVPGEVEA